ncbi:MAG: ribosome biogenesis GTPase YlqF, partial [Oscillospiraceae bacterium]|nr:ribosome biogenesis GTPase YlqF [Oscillospiraceae bacterium]
MSDFQKQTVQWFPGHMAKTRRMIKEVLPLIDAVVEITDARIPQSSRNPELDEMTLNRPRIILLNKSDMADISATKQWLCHYKEKGIHAMAVDCKSGKGLSGFDLLVK